MRRARTPLVLLLALAGLAFASCKGRTPFYREARWSAPRKGAVASEHPLATRVGLDVLERGGNAADAAVAVALALAVVYPQAGNLGGGGFALWVPHVGESLALDFRETAPAAAAPERYLGPDGKRVDARSLRGPLAVAVPGSPRGIHALWRERGSRRLGFHELVAPAIRLAREGFPVDAWLARELQDEKNRDKMNAAALAVFYPGGRAIAEGEILRQPALAETLALFAREGADAVHTGRIAEAIVAELSASPVPGAEGPGEAGASGAGWMTLADLAGYQVVPRAALHGWFRGMEIVTMPPPSAGGLVLLQTLGVLEGMPLDAQKNRAAAEDAIQRGQGSDRAGAPRLDTPLLDERMAHWWIEALRVAYADRARHLGDPDFVSIPTQALLSPEWIARRRVAIGANADPGVSAWEPPRGAPEGETREGSQTTHLSVLDAAGNAVSLTTTVNSWFGSGILVRGAGFFLNDEMDDFAIQAGSPNQFGLVGGGANALAPGRRPLSSMTPTVVRDGGHANVIVLGSPGGPRIPSAILQVLLRVLVLEQTMEQAVAAPRLHQQWSPSATIFEPAFDPEIVSALANRRGHETEVKSERFGSVQAIWLPELGAPPQAVSDPRRGGAAGVQGGRVSTPARPPAQPPP